MTSLTTASDSSKDVASTARVLTVAGLEPLGRRTPSDGSTSSLSTAPSSTRLEQHLKAEELLESTGRRRQTKTTKRLPATTSTLGSSMGRGSRLVQRLGGAEEGDDDEEPTAGVGGTSASIRDAAMKSTMKPGSMAAKSIQATSGVRPRSTLSREQELDQLSFGNPDVMDALIAQQEQPTAKNSRFISARVPTKEGSTATTNHHERNSQVNLRVKEQILEDAEELTGTSALQVEMEKEILEGTVKRRVFAGRERVTPRYKTRRDEEELMKDLYDAIEEKTPGNSKHPLDRKMHERLSHEQQMEIVYAPVELPDEIVETMFEERVALDRRLREKKKRQATYAARSTAGRAESEADFAEQVALKRTGREALQRMLGPD